MIPSNLHTHTVFCDGHDTPEELVVRALELGCPAIGFSGHSYTEFDTDYCMSPENEKLYKEEISRLKGKYAGKIKIFLGVEKDLFSPSDTKDYEYIIGSVHYVKKNGRYIPVDLSAEAQIEAVNKFYGGDFYSFCRDYYSLVARVYEKTKCDIVGHFDLITKFNEGNGLFDTEDARYISAAADALDALLKCDCAFEINTGAISRGYRKTPYPEKRWIEKAEKAGKHIIYTSDCHRKENLIDFLPEEKISSFSLIGLK